jgi:16S rRNA (guanine1207-N2)-methyltransferase
MDLATLNLLYQPSNAWMLYGLRVARHALRIGGRLYVAGAKDRGILTMAKRMQELFGNVETLVISKGQRVLCSIQQHIPPMQEEDQEQGDLTLNIFAGSKLDEGTSLLLDALQVHATDLVLDLGCGAGFIGLHCAHLATQGHVVMVDVSQAAVAASQRAIRESGMGNIEALPSDGIAAIQPRRFDLVATNPPFHIGGIQTTTTAERFIREAAQVLRSGGRFYLVANRFLKYEPVIQDHFQHWEEVAGNGRYKVLRADRAH